jgi:hypothetical protein
LLKRTIGTPTTYALSLKDFTNFIESWSPFSNTPRMKDLNLLPHEPTWVVGFDRD